MPPMHPPILLLISNDSHARLLLEQALDPCSATILSATSTEEGLRILKDQAALALVVCDESQGRIASQVILSQARRRGARSHSTTVIAPSSRVIARSAWKRLGRKT